MTGRIAVVGGANMDIGGFSRDPILDGDSNIGTVRMSAGGVGRNIAENSARLGLDTALISVIGDDTNGKVLLDGLKACGIDFSAGLVSPDVSTSVYLYLMDSDNDMHCAVNDMRAQTMLTPEFVSERFDTLNGMDAVCVDANLSPATLERVTSGLNVPVFADAVSFAKAGRLRGCLGRLHTLKPNRTEAELLSGVMINDSQDAMRAAKQLISMGLKRVFITLGSHGTVCADSEECHYLRGRKLPMASASGAGDAFTAGLLWAYSNGLSLRESAIAAMSCASIALESVETVNPMMNEQLLKDRILEYKEET